MARIILITSGKGGTGKTMFSANLAYALAQLNNKVYVVDGNLTTPHLSFYYGFSLVPKTLHNFLKGETSIRDIVYFHPSGVRVIPGSIRLEDITNADPSKMADLLLGLVPNADFIIIDGSAGLGRETLIALQMCDEVIVIAIPEITSLTDAKKISKLAEELNKKVLGVVLNRVNPKLKKENLIRIVENFTGLKVLGYIIEDKKVSLSLNARKPLFEIFPNSPVSLEIKRIAYQLIGKEFKPKTPSLLQRIKNLLRL